MNHNPQRTAADIPAALRTSIFYQMPVWYASRSLRHCLLAPLQQYGGASTLALYLPHGNYPSE